MDKIQIETAHNVSIEHNIANVTSRITALLFDWVMYFIYYLLSLTVITSISRDNKVIFILIYLPIFLYHLLFEYLMDGQSPGKKLNNIKVVNLDGSRPTFVSYLLRWVFRIIDMLFFGSVALFTILINGKGQRLGDIVAGTVVVDINKNYNAQKSIFNDIDEDYEPVFPQAALLTDSDIKKIKEVFISAKRRQSRQVIINLKNKIQEITGIESEMKDVEFINTIIKDYYYLTSQK